MRDEERCTICGHDKGRLIFEQTAVPVHQNRPQSTREAARDCSRADVRLRYCGHCGHIYNDAFDSGRLEYAEGYENSQVHSAAFRSYMTCIAQHLIAKFKMTGKTIIEVGCGQGDFLRLFCSLSDGTGIGFDPGYRGETPPGPREQYIRDFYTDRYTHISGDLFCSRHVLDHMDAPVSLLGPIHRAMSERSGAVAFFEIPSVEWILRHMAFWDLYYEHCSYFSQQSLASALARSGLQPLEIRPAFGGQYLWAEAREADQTEHQLDREPSLGALDQAVHNFLEAYPLVIAELRQSIDRNLDKGKRLLLWGAGAKGTTLLNTLGVGFDRVPYVVDVNPRKHGRYLPGTAQMIVPPRSLLDYRPDLIWVMNPNYVAEVRDCVSELGLQCDVVDPFTADQLRLDLL